MKINFYISCEDADEVQSCIEFIAKMNKRRAEKDEVPLPKFTPNAKVPIAAPRENISPGDPAISKMGAATKEHILKQLEQGEQPSAAYSEHLKLMWARGEVQFDGTRYFIS